MSSIQLLRARVSRVSQEAEGIRSYELVPTEGASLPPFEPGAHLDIHVPGGLVRSYSLCNDSAETHRYLIAVQSEAHGRGGSRAMHERVRPGDVLTTSPPRNDFPLLHARRYLLIAGGIGITPLLSMAHALRRSGADWFLAYCSRSPERTAFRQVLATPGFAEHVLLHHDEGEPSRGLDLSGLIASHAPGTRLFCCGPAGLMRAVRETALRLDWPEEKLHFESFSSEGTAATAATPDAPFHVIARSRGAAWSVPPGRSVLSVLRENGLQVPSDCEAGTCGTCLTRVLEGQPEHRDSVLSQEEKAAGRDMLVCVSRAKSSRLVLDV